MYKSAKQSIVLWCDARTSESNCDSRKCKDDSPPAHAPPSKRQSIEDGVKETVRDLQEKHGTKYSIPQFRLWARMIAAGNHASTDDPPQIPEITGVTPKREKKESLQVALAGAAATFAHALRNPTIQPSAGPSSSNSVVITTESPPVTPTANRRSATSHIGPVGLSPGRVTDLRRKKLQELRELQELLEANILSMGEFSEQKTLVLDSLRKLQ